MKQEQIRILSSQNSELISSLDRAEEELGTLQHERLTLEEENRSLRESNFELQAKTKSAEGRLEEVNLGYEDVESQLTTMTTKNAELFNLLEREEANTSKIAVELEVCKVESSSLGEKYNALIQSSRESEETAKNATRENQLKTDEIRVLRTEVDQLQRKNSELTIQSTVELEAVQEQLRLRKEKQYQLLGKLQSQEEASRHAEDHAKEMEQNVRDLRQKSSELQTALQLETNARISQDNSNRTLTIDFQATSAENKELGSKLQELEQDRLKLEAEARDNGEQLREMAEKVFQLLERLKLAELGKKKSMEALTKKEQELFALKKQQSKITEDNANQRRAREKVEAEKRVIDDQLRGLKKVNSQLSQKLKEEAKCRIREEEACKEANEKVRTLDGRLAFLLNRLQTDEEAKSVQQDEIKKMESQLQGVTQRCETLQTKLTHAEDSARDANEKLQQSDKQLKESTIKHKSLEQTLKLQEENEIKAERKSIQSKGKSDNNLAGGQLRFFVDNRPSLGHAVVTGKCPKDKVWIDEKGCNIFLRKALKSQNAQESLVKRIAELYGAILFGEEQREKVNADLKAKEEEMERFDRELNIIQSDVLREEESKRRILLRYIRAVKASVSLGEPGCEEDRKEVGGVGSGRINLPEASLGDEEVHVVAAMLRNNVTIEELQFRRNNIGDDGARAIAAVLAERSALKLIDLRENRVSMIGVKAIADALERSERIHKVMVHPGGKIEAFGASETIGESESTAFAVRTMCIVDVRENQPKCDTQKGKPAQKRCHPERKGNKNNVSQSPSVKHRPRKSGSVRASSADAAKGVDSKVNANRQSVSAPNKMKRHLPKR
ncbi:hypothetical protein ACHAXR_005161 [Thalassiosira sp. AJA248-18]